MSQSSEVTINNCTFSGNVAHHGGGLFNDGGKVTSNNCTFSGNTASAWGGGLYNNFGCEATITFSTFVNNTASVAGGLAAGFPLLSISTTIVANNTAKFSKKQNGIDQMASLGFNLESGTDCGFSDPVHNDQQNTDPMLDPTGLKKNGGFYSNYCSANRQSSNRCYPHSIVSAYRPTWLSVSNRTFLLRYRGLSVLISSPSGTTFSLKVGMLTT